MRKFLTWILVLTLAGLAGYAGWILYDLGKLHGAEDLKALRTEHALLERVHKKLVKESEALRERVAILDRSSQIDRLAAKEVQDKLGSLQEDLQEARVEIEFYRGIVAPGDVKPGLRIYRFTLKNGSQPGQFRYDLVLTQLKRNDRYVKGLVNWKIVGTVDDEIHELDLAAVTKSETGPLKFRFRYFQHFTGVISLPEGYKPQAVILSIKATGKKAPEPVEQTFEWPAAET